MAGFYRIGTPAPHALTPPRRATKKKSPHFTLIRAHAHMHIIAKRHKRHIETDFQRNLFILHALSL